MARLISKLLHGSLFCGFSTSTLLMALNLESKIKSNSTLSKSFALINLINSFSTESISLRTLLFAIL